MLSFDSLLTALTPDGGVDGRSDSAISLFMPRCESGSALRHEPGHHVGDVLRRHRLVRRVSPPVRLPEVLPAGDRRRAQRLVARERKKIPVNDGATFRSAPAIRAMTPGTVGPENLRSTLRVTGT